MLIILKANASVSYILNYLQNESTVTAVVEKAQSLDPSDPNNYDVYGYEIFSKPLNSEIIKININNNVASTDIFTIGVRLEYPMPVFKNDPETQFGFTLLNPITYYKVYTGNTVLSDFSTSGLAIDQSTLQNCGTVWIDYYFSVYSWSDGLRYAINNDNNNYKIELNSVPEPSALSLLAVGLGGLAILRRRRS